MNGYAMYVDAHCHLCAVDFDHDIDEVIAKAKENNVAAALVVPESFDEFTKVLSLSNRYPEFILPCLGVHPVQGEPHGEQRSVCPKDLADALPFIEEHADKLFAVGEVGLDFTPRLCKEENSKENQKDVFAQQIQLAKKLDLPLNVHSRSAGRPTIAFLKEQGATKVLLHAFDGKPSVALDGVAAGFYFSIPPSIVRSEQKQKLVQKIPLDRILLETDSPALGPEKQVRNEPSNIRLSCEYIAKIKNVDSNTVMRATTENALRLFPKLRKILKL